MARLPINIPSGYVAVYGLGTETSSTGIRPGNTDYRFASVYDIWAGGETYLKQDNEIMFDQTKVRLVTYFHDLPYSIVPARLATKMDILE